ASVKLAKLTRDLQFRQHAVLSTTASFIDVVIAVSLATTIGPWAIVVGLLARATATSALSYVLAPYRPRWLIDRVALGAIWQFGRWVALTSVITIAGNLALQAVISRRLGTTDLGIYALSLTLANLPEDTAASVVGGVAFPVHARVQDDVERTRRALQAHLTAMAVLVLPVYAAIMVLAPGGAETVLGERWSDAGQLIVLLSAASVIGIVADVVIPLFEGMRQPSRVTALLAVRTAVILTTVSWLAGAHGLLGAGIAIVIAELAVLVLAATLAARAVPHAWDGSERPLAGIAACAAMGAALALAIRTLGSGTIAVGMVGALAVATSLGALMWLDRVLALGIRRDAARAFPALAGTRPAPGVDERVR
ncbi:MAG: oligosaccharide flippase family protein, partial [Acidimicrobiales bacterium]